MYSLRPLESSLSYRPFGFYALAMVSWRPCTFTCTSETAYEFDFGSMFALGRFPFLPKPISLPVRFLTWEFFVDLLSSLALSSIEESALRVELYSLGREDARIVPSLTIGGPASKLFWRDKLRTPPFLGFLNCFVTDFANLACAMPPMSLLAAALCFIKMSREIN